MKSIRLTKTLGLLLVLCLVMLLSVLPMQAFAEGEGEPAPVHTHSGGEARCNAKAQCAECGASYGEFGGQKFSEATCKKKAECE